MAGNLKVLMGSYISLVVRSFSLKAVETQCLVVLCHQLAQRLIPGSSHSFDE